MLVITGPSLDINIKTPTLEMVTRSWTLPELVRSLQRAGAEERMRMVAVLLTMLAHQVTTHFKCEASSLKYFIYLSSNL